MRSRMRGPCVSRFSGQNGLFGNGLWRDLWQAADLLVDLEAKPLELAGEEHVTIAYGCEPHADAARARRTKDGGRIPAAGSRFVVRPSSFVFQGVEAGSDAAEGKIEDDEHADEHEGAGKPDDGHSGVAYDL